MARLALPVLAVLLGLGPACSGGGPGAGRPSPSREATPPETSIPAPRSVGGLLARRTEASGVVADLLSAERRDGGLTVSIRFRNTGPGPRRIAIPANYATGWRLVAGDRVWSLASEPDGDPAATETPDRELDPGASALWRGTFVAPPAGVDAFRLEVPGVEVFEDVPITDVE